jgi:hypothetical protein
MRAGAVGQGWVVFYTVVMDEGGPALGLHELSTLVALYGSPYAFAHDVSGSVSLSAIQASTPSLHRLPSP